MKWYAHDPNAALAGMIGLTVEERGAYYTLMDLQYARAPGGDVTDELVIKALAVRPQVWRRLKAGLMAKGKVHETDGKLTANSVETRVKLAVNRIDKMTVLANKRWKNKDLGNATPHMTTTTTSTDIEAEASISVPPRRKPKRAKPQSEFTKFPDGWEPTDLASADRNEFEKFKASALAHGRTYVSWPGAWGYWKRNAPNFNGGNGNGRPGQAPPKSGITTAINGLIERLEREEETSGVPRQTDFRMLPGGRR